MTGLHLLFEGGSTIHLVLTWLTAESLLPLRMLLAPVQDAKFLLQLGSLVAGRTAGLPLTDLTRLSFYPACLDVLAAWTVQITEPPQKAIQTGIASKKPAGVLRSLGGSEGVL